MPGTQPTIPLLLDTPAPATDVLIGQQVGEYVVEAAIAAGGMGIVYRAVHPIIGRRVAIKVVRPEMMSDKEQADRFLKEAQALSAIKHRGIIEIIGFGNLPDGRQYMVMEFLEGESLEAVMGREGPMSAARALPIIDEILSALGSAHKVGVVHRDLKPSNVFISLATSGERNVKVLDFGLAKHAPIALDGVVGEVGAKASLMAGTPEYIAPEQARGLVATPQTDLYCVGVMLFEMLSGELPFKAPSVMELMKKHVYEAPPRLSSRVNGMPESLDGLVAVLLEKDPELRPASADVARQTVTRILRELREQSTRQGPNPLNVPGPRSPAATVIVTSKLPAPIRSSPPPTKDRSPAFALPLLLLLVFLAGAGSLFLFTRTRAPEDLAVPPPPQGVIRSIEAAVGAAPPPAATPIAVDPTPAAKAPQAEPLPPLPPRKVEPKVVVVPPAPVDNSDCDPTDAWKTDRTSFLGRLENKLLERMAGTPQGVPEPKVLEKLHAIRNRVNNAATANDCMAVRRDLEAWERAHNR